MSYGILDIGIYWRPTMCWGYSNEQTGKFPVLMELALLRGRDSK